MRYGGYVIDTRVRKIQIEQTVTNVKVLQRCVGDVATPCET